MTARQVPYPGDHIRVVYEGRLRAGLTPDGFSQIEATSVGDVISLSLDAAVSVEVLLPPQPPVGTVLIGYDSPADERLSDEIPWVCQRDLEAWRTMGSSRNYTFEEVWERTAHDRQVLTP